PDRSRDQVEPVEREREAARRSLSRMSSEAGYEQGCSGGADRPDECDHAGDRPLATLRPVEPDCNSRRADEEREYQLEIAPAPPKGRHPDEREEGAETPEGAKCELRCRKQQVDRNRQKRDR